MNVGKRANFFFPPILAYCWNSYMLLVTRALQFNFIFHVFSTVLFNF